MKINFKITNLHCPACVKISSMALKKMPGVKNVEVEQSGVATVEADRDITKEEIEKTMNEVEKTISFD